MNIYDFFAELDKDDNSLNLKSQKYSFIDNLITDDILAKADDKDLFVLIKNVMTLSICFRNRDAVFKLRYIWQNGVTSFSLEDISEKDISVLESLDLCRLPLPVRAQINDVLWQKNNDYKSAILVAKTYFELYTVTFDVENWIDCVNKIYQAVNLSAAINHKECLNKCLSQVFADLIKTDGQDKLFYFIQMIELLLSQKHSIDISTLIPITDNLIAGNKTLVPCIIKKV